MKILLSCILILVAGFVAGLNLAMMFPNPEYEASWFPVMISALIAAFSTFLIYLKTRP